MKRFKQRKKNDIVIDLTSMLDVIFIVLLVVTAGNSLKQGQLDEEKQSYSDKEAEYNNSQMLYDDAVDTVRYFKSISVTVPYNPDEVHKREIQMLFFGEEKSENIELIGSDTEDSVQQFQSRLVDYISENQDSPIVLSLNDDDDKILFRDEKMITEVFSELSSEFDNVYIKGNLGKVEP